MYLLPGNTKEKRNPIATIGVLSSTSSILAVLLHIEPKATKTKNKNSGDDDDNENEQPA